MLKRLSQSSHTLHWGLGAAATVPRLTVRWHAGETQEFTGIVADTYYEIAEGDSEPRRLSSGDTGVTPRSGTSVPAGTPTPGGAPSDVRQRQMDFWKAQRAAMDAMKVRRNNAEAIRRFREAIALDPLHEDSRYYLGLCLASEGDTPAALAALEELQRLNPQSHRAWQQWGVIRAIHAQADADLDAAEHALRQAQSINPEETGALLVLGEVALLRGDLTLAERRLSDATRTNPRAAGGFFLRGYVAWKRGDEAAARQLLEQTRTALGPEWTPKGSTSEGDVTRKQHVEKTPLAAHWEGWDGIVDPARTYRGLEASLDGRRESRTSWEPSRQP